MHFDQSVQAMAEETEKPFALNWLETESRPLTAKLECWTERACG